MTYDFDALLDRVEKPARYTGGEMNAEVKPISQAEISFAFCFPDTYEVAMSHLGMKILYGILNELPYAVCERVCMPWVDMLCELRKNNIPLCSLESHTPLSRFDIIGFTLQYEMSYTNVLEMMDLGGVPVLSSERGEDDPIVLAGRLTDELRDQRVSLSLPSLRVDKFVQDTLTHTQKVKKSSLTFAPEAGTQRLRDVINKNVTEADLVNTLTNAFSNGWNAVKLYFMTGLPTETDEDLIGIAELAKTAAGAYYSVPKEKRVKGLRIMCSAAVFVPKPFTPFQWCRQDDPETVRRKQRLVREHFAPLKSAHFNYHDSGVSQIEACFALGDRRLARVLHRAWQLGCRLDGWTDQFRYDLWLQAFEDCGLDIAFYAHRERALDELLPWDHIDAGIDKAFLKREYERAMRAQTTRDCREGCNGCGLQKLKGVCRACE